MNALYLELFLAIVMAGIIWLVAFRPRQREKEQCRDPFTERTLRPPEESLRRKIQELDDQLDDWLLCYLFHQRQQSVVHLEKIQHLDWVFAQSV